MAELEATEIHAPLCELAVRYGLPGSAAGQLLALLDLVRDDRQAPTTVRDPKAALDDHLADSLVALELEPVRAARMVADIGSGAGFPGLPLAIALPHTRVALVESSSRKCAYLNRAVRACSAQNASVACTRVEDWRDGIGRCDLVTARAVAHPAVVAEYAAPLLKLGGAVVIWRGRRDPEAEDAATRAARELGLEVQAPVAVHPYARASNRNLHLMFKVRETPARFPRRAGVAVKRPLGR